MKIGIAGFGFMGRMHLAAIASIPNTAVTAIASRTRPSADAPVQGNLPNTKPLVIPDNLQWFPGWRAMLESDIDAIDICLPTPLHKEVALAAFEHGKHVLCEKPLALTPADCEEILQAAERSKRVFMVAHVLRFKFAYQYAASFLRETCNGIPRTCVLRRKTGFPRWGAWLADGKQSGGATLDLLIHDIDQALKFFGPPQSVTAISDGPIDTTQATLRYGNGLQVKLEGGFYAPDQPFSAGFTIVGNNAELSLEKDELWLTSSSGKQRIAIPEEDEYANEIQYFAKCCRQNTTPTQCPPTESAAAVELALLLKASREQQGRELPFRSK